MFLKVRIEEEQFKVSIGSGLNDWVWLAHHASRIYSKTIYPQGTYLPTLVYLQNIYKHLEYHPHPRQKISRYLQAYAINSSQILCVVKIKKANHSYSQFQKKWQKRAYEKEQYFITFNFTYLAANVNRKKDFMLKVKTQYSMADEMKHIFHQKQFPSEIRTLMQQRQIGPTESKFQATLQVPRGSTSHKLYYYERDNAGQQYVQTQISQKKLKKDDFIITEEPLYIPHYEILSIVQSQMKIQDDINKTLQQKQLQTKKRNASSSLCCFTFEQLWDTITRQYKQELSLQEYQKSTIQRIKLCIEKSLHQLYEIFFYYFILQNQQKDKKQDLGIIYQDIMHFLRDYGVLVDLVNLNNFLEYYNVDESRYKNIEHTLDLKDHSIKFPQFIVILLRSIQFVQTSTFLMKGQTFDSAATKIFQKVIQVDSQVSDFSSFRRNLRQNPKIISFIRSNSQKLKQIYSWMCKKSIQSSSSCMIIMKQQLKQLLITFHLVDNNVDKVINECFKELRLNQQGIFYYEYLIVIQWLAMATIADQKQDQIQNEEEQSLMIVEKMKYFLHKINIQ